MNAQRQTNTFNRGMNMDVDYFALEHSQYRYAENIRVTTNNNGSTAAIQNIEGILGLSNINGKLWLSEEIIHVDTIRDWAIIFTHSKNKVNEQDVFNIYRIDFSKSEMEPTVNKLFKQPLPLNINYVDDKYTISSVCRWESENNVKIYWADGKNSIRVLNVDYAHCNNEYEGNFYSAIENPEDLDIIPASVLPPPVYLTTSYGSLKAGKYQFCYQLFNERGSETSVSALSKLIHVSKDDLNLDFTKLSGSTVEENTNKSIVLQINLPNSIFTKAKLICIYYPNNSAIPLITVLNNISFTGNTFEYTVTDNNAITELSIDEFYSLTGYDFIPKVLESKDNMLFAADIIENTWDIDYDARAYSCDNDGTVLLKSNSGQDDKTFSIDNIASDIPLNHDCINPSNLDDTTNKYCFTKDLQGNYIYGGKGLNIEYRFITADLIEDNTAAVPTDNGVRYNNSFTFTSEPVQSSSIPVYYINFDGTKVKATDIKLNENKRRLFNYANPEIDSLVCGYQRDEIYRFGIIFYNKKNLASPVHWISDIRIPNATTKGFETFTNNVNSPDNSELQNCSVITHPIGIEFNVNNLPEDVVAYEIVRCERTALDRTIISQGIISQVIQHLTDNGLLACMPYLSYSNKHGFISVYTETGEVGSSVDTSHADAWNWQVNGNATDNSDRPVDDLFHHSGVSNNYFIFVSPEVCVNRDMSAELIEQGKTISPISYLSSPIVIPENATSDVSYPHDISVWASPTYSRVMASSELVKIKKDGVLTLGEAGNLSKFNGVVYDWTRVDRSDHDIKVKNSIRLDSGRGDESNGTYYTTSLAKYYKATEISNPKTADIEDIKIAVNTFPFDLHSEEWRTKGINIGDKTFYNWVFDQYTNSDDSEPTRVRKLGPHGICAVFKSENLNKNIPYVDSTVSDTDNDTVKINKLDNTNAVLLCNIKRSVTPYGGNTYSARQNSIYISTGSYSLRDNSKNTVFGGDTYINILDYANCMFAFDSENYDANTKNRLYNGAFIPVESSVNLSLRNDDSQVSKTVEYQNITSKRQEYSNHFVQNDIIRIGDIYSQNTQLYSYNDAYSTESTLKTFISKPEFTIDNLHMDSRVMNSEPKTNNELFDSWTKFRVANYIDVDNRYGSINRLLLFNNMLFFWQDDAFGALSVNERSIISDNNFGSLTLGTGGILTRYDYVSSSNGLKKNQLNAVTSSLSGIYWYDADRHEICTYTGRVGELSKIKGVQSYLNNTDTPLISNPKLTYDKKYNEVLLTLDSNKTLIYNELLTAFSSFYTISPTNYISFTDKLYIFNENNLYKYNSGDDKPLHNHKISYIQFVVNDGYPQTKTFDNVEFDGKFTDNKSFSEIYFETKRQISDKLTNTQIDYREDTYKFAIPRNSIVLNAAEQLLNKSFKDRMKGKYLVCNYKYDCKDGNTFKVPYISTAYRYSMI